MGADGAPFGKDSEATAWLVSLIYAGKHIQSENDNFLICEANCSEDHKSMQRYAKKLMEDIAHISMCGELNNAFFCFAPFGNVNSDNTAVPNGSLGESSSCTWQTLYYGRIAAAKKVAKKKEEISK